MSLSSTSNTRWACPRTDHGDGDCDGDEVVPKVSQCKSKDGQVEMEPEDKEGEEKCLGRSVEGRQIGVGLRR